MAIKKYPSFENKALYMKVIQIFENNKFVDFDSFQCFSTGRLVNPDNKKAIDNYLKLFKNAKTKTKIIIRKYEFGGTIKSK